MRNRLVWGMIAAWAAWLALSIQPFAQAAQAVVPSDNYDVLYARYLEAARATPAPRTDAPRYDWMSGLLADLSARRVNDLVTISIVESIVAVGSADSTLSKESSASAAVPNLFGLETKLPSWLDPTRLVNGSTGTDFKGGGVTSRSGELTAVITARVVDVLPNGDLVVEGAREIDINGDRQVVVLTGVVRTADISPDNVVPSPKVGQLRIRYFGRGLIKDNLKPGWLIRVLNKIF